MPHLAETNLALDQAMYAALERGGPACFRLYINPACVVIGRHQEVAREVDLNLLDTDGIPVFRRFTGGGAVWHDLGNVNFAIAEPRENPASPLCWERYAGWLLPFLDALGLAGRIEKNRVEVGGKKVTGMAARLGRRSVFVHGTLLVNAELDALAKYLTPPQAQLDALPPSRGRHVESDRRPVSNLAELSGEDLRALSLLETCQAQLGAHFSGANRFDP